MSIDEERTGTRLDPARSRYLGLTWSPINEVDATTY
jgi:hypothetical protein